MIMNTVRFFCCIFPPFLRPCSAQDVDVERFPGSRGEDARSGSGAVRAKPAGVVSSFSALQRTLPVVGDYMPPFCSELGRGPLHRSGGRRVGLGELRDTPRAPLIGLLTGLPLSMRPAVEAITALPRSVAERCGFLLRATAGKVALSQFDATPATNRSCLSVRLLPIPRPRLCSLCRRHGEGCPWRAIYSLAVSDAGAASLAGRSPLHFH